MPPTWVCKLIPDTEFERIGRCVHRHDCTQTQSEFFWIWIKLTNFFYGSSRCGFYLRDVLRPLLKIWAVYLRPVYCIFKLCFIHCVILVEFRYGGFNLKVYHSWCMSKNNYDKWCECEGVCVCVFACRCDHDKRVRMCNKTSRHIKQINACKQWNIH